MYDQDDVPPPAQVDSSASRIPRLSAKTWLRWKQRVRWLLIEKQLWQYVDGTAKLPNHPSEKQHEAYKRQDSIALARLAQEVSDDYLNLVDNAKTTREAWLNLESCFQNKGAGDKRLLRRQLIGAKMPEPRRGKESECVEAHLIWMRGLVSQLQSLGEEYSMRDYAEAVFESLPDYYQTTASSISSRTDAELDAAGAEDFIHSCIIADARRKDNRAAHGSGFTSSGFQSGEQQSVYKTGTFYCHNCQKPGHYARDCRYPRQDGPGPSQRGQHPRGRARGNRGAFRGKYNRGGRGNQSSNRGRGRQGGQAYTLLTTAALCHKDNGEPLCEAGTWLYDSAATVHMTSDRETMVDYEPFDEPGDVRMGNNEPLQAFGKGTVTVVMTKLKGRNRTVNITDVWYVPDLRANLLSGPALDLRGCETLLGQRRCVLWDPDGQVIGTGKLLEDRLYQLHCRTAGAKQSQVVAKAEAEVKLPKKVRQKNMLQLWHQRLGHISHRYLRSMKHCSMVDGLEFSDDDHGQFCQGCALGKQTKRSKGRHRGRRAKRVLDLIHTDVCGVQTESKNGKRYFVTFIDDHSRYTFVYPIRHKDEVVEKLRDFEKLVTTQTGRKIKVIRSDNGGEYVNAEFEEFCREKGIVHQTTVPRNPQMNGVAERCNRTLMDSVRSMLHHAGLSEGFWVEAIQTAVYIKNRVMTKSLYKMTPHEAWTDRRPSIRHIRTFGSTAFVQIQEEKRSKLGPKSKLCRLLGFLDSGGYRLYDPETGRIEHSKDVVFTEDHEEDPQPADGEDGRGDEADPQPDSGQQMAETEVVDSDVGTDSEQQSSSQEQDVPKPQPVAVRRSERLQAKREASRQEVALVVQVDSEHNDQDEPTTVSEAMSGPDSEKWDSSMHNEIGSLKKNNTWILTELPEGRHAIDCKWVFRIKRNADGSINKHKSRLVIRGFEQVEGVDYFETFAPVMYLASLRSLIAKATIGNMQLHQMDVCTAFLNGDLEEDIYMVQPEGFAEPGKEHLVCKLQRSLYGLKQAPRSWNNKINSYLEELGFERSQADPCIYSKKKGENSVIVGLYVDDLVIACDRTDDMNELKKQLSDRFEMTDLGPLHYVLGIEVERSGDTTKIHQTRPDICNAVAAAAQYNSNPGRAHWVAVKRILRYLKGTTDVGIQYGGPDVTSELFGYSDADFAGDVETRKSCSGFVFYYGGGPIVWKSQKQKSVALSTMEAEYIALGLAVQELFWLRQLMVSLHCPQEGATTVYEDNQAAIAVARNPIVHSRAKHVDVKLHFTREAVSDGTVDLVYCPSSENIADVMTKGLSKPTFESLRQCMCTEPSRDDKKMKKSKAEALQAKAIQAEKTVMKSKRVPTPVVAQAVTAPPVPESVGAMRDSSSVVQKQEPPISKVRSEAKKRSAKKQCRRLPGKQASSSCSVSPWLGLAILAMFVVSGCFAMPLKVKPYQFCGGTREGSRVIKVTELGQYGPVAFASPTLAARMKFNRTNIAAENLGFDKDILIWNCTKIQAMEKFVAPDTPEDGKLHEEPSYQQVTDVNTGKTLFIHPLGELVRRSPPAWSYVVNNITAAKPPTAGSKAERALIDKWTDPIFDGDYVLLQATKLEGVAEAIRLLANFANEKTFDSQFRVGEFLPLVKRNTSFLGKVTNFITSGKFQLIINALVLLMAVFFVVKLLVLVYNLFKCVRSVAKGCIFCCKLCCNSADTTGIGSGVNETIMMRR